MILIPSFTSPQVDSYQQPAPSATGGLKLDNAKLRDQVTDLDRKLRHKTEELDQLKREKDRAMMSEQACAEELGKSKMEIAELKRKRKWTIGG